MQSDRQTENVVDEVEGTKTFVVAGSAYDKFMGRYSLALADPFADTAGVGQGETAIDVGCGPGALTGVLVDRLGADAVAACDPSPGFVADCSARHVGVQVKAGRAESIPFETDSFDHALAQLVVHFVSDPDLAASEMIRVVRPGGRVSACVWDFQGMEMLRHFWDAALTIDPTAPDEARTMRFGRLGELAELLTSAGMDNIVESTLQVSSSYQSFEEFWDGFLAGVGPAGAYCVSRPEADQQHLRQELFQRLNAPAGAFTLGAIARCVTARVRD